MVYSAEWICENGHCPSRKTSLSKFAHLVSAFSKERLTGKFKNGFFLTLKETLVVKLAQRAIIYIFFDWFPNVSFCLLGFNKTGSPNHWW